MIKGLPLILKHTSSEANFIIRKDVFTAGRDILY